MKTLPEIKDLILAAEINLEHLADLVKDLNLHPFYKIVKWQLKCAYSDEDPSIQEAEEPALRPKKWNVYERKD